MDFAVNIPTSVGESKSTHLVFADQSNWEIQREFGTSMESFGFDGLAVPDHLMTGRGATECTTTVTGLACETSEVYLYPKTINNPLRHGPLLAKIAATIDNISGGRLKLGMGAGWHEEEAMAYGYEWPNAPDRLRAMEETIELMKLLWTQGDDVDYDGDYYSLNGASCKPRPVQDPHPPIMVGGEGEEFTLRITAQYADTWNLPSRSAAFDVAQRKLDVLRSHCDTYGRDYNDIEKSWFTRCVIRETQEEVDELLDRVPRFRNHTETENPLVGTPADVSAEIERYRDELGMEECVVEFIDFPRTTGAELFADEVIPHFK